VQVPELSMLATARYLPGMSNPSYLICFTPPGQKKLPRTSCTASEQKALAETTEAALPKRTADEYLILNEFMSAYTVGRETGNHDLKSRRVKTSRS
jgi:hypothetical protein